MRVSWNRVALEKSLSSYCVTSEKSRIKQILNLNWETKHIQQASDKLWPCRMFEECFCFMYVSKNCPASFRCPQGTHTLEPEHPLT